MNEDKWEVTPLERRFEQVRQTLNQSEERQCTTAEEEKIRRCCESVPQQEYALLERAMRDEGLSVPFPMQYAEKKGPAVFQHFKAVGRLPTLMTVLEILRQKDG